MAIKGQVLVDFVAEFTLGLVSKEAISENKPGNDPAVLEHNPKLSNSSQAEFITKRSIPPNRAKIFIGHAWHFYVDSASNNRDAGARIVLVSPSRTMHKHALSIGFPASNNEAEYQALIAGL